MRILHLSADYPDPLQPAKTRAVANLLPLVPEHEHLVYSLNRVDWRRGIAAIDFADAAGGAHRAVAYGAPPAGLFLERFLNRLADWIVADLARRGLRPDAVHAHKLSVEGLAAARIAEALGAPLVVSVQANSDLKIVGVKRGLRQRYRALWREARVIFPFAPWAGKGLTALLGPREGPVRLLPCPAARAETRLSPTAAGPVFVTAFHFRDWGNKNAEGLIRAVGLAAARVPGIRLRVVGGGDPAAFARLRGLADRHAPGRVIFEGAVPNEQVGALFNAACAFALVSHRESFGMVFSEALLAGAPCLIPAGTAIDGYFPDGEATLSAPSRDTPAIADGLVRLAREEAAFKERLARMQESGALAVMTRERIAETYRDGLRNVA